MLYLGYLQVLSRDIQLYFLNFIVKSPLLLFTTKNKKSHSFMKNYEIVI